MPIRNDRRHDRGPVPCQDFPEQFIDKHPLGLTRSSQGLWRSRLVCRLLAGPKNHRGAPSFHFRGGGIRTRANPFLNGLRFTNPRKVEPATNWTRLQWVGTKRLNEKVHHRTLDAVELPGKFVDVWLLRCERFKKKRRQALFEKRDIKTLERSRELRRVRAVRHSGSPACCARQRQSAAPHIADFLLGKASEEVPEIGQLVDFGE